jgi:hypothetical protein
MSGARFLEEISIGLLILSLNGLAKKMWLALKKHGTQELCVQTIHW